MLSVIRGTFLGWKGVLEGGRCFLDAVVCGRRATWRGCICGGVLCGVGDSGSAVVEVVGPGVHDSELINILEIDSKNISCKVIKQRLSADEIQYNQAVI